MSNLVFIKTQCVSYPRSGRGLMLRIIKNYFMIGYNYEIIKCLPGRKTGLINEEGVNFASNHDFHNSVPKKQNWNYLIQYRNPIRSIVSYTKKAGFNKEFKKFFNHNLGIKHWTKLINRWVINPPPNALLIDYEDLILDNENTIKKTVEFISNQKFDVEIYKESVKEINIKPRNFLENFADSNNYDYFDKIENDLKYITKKLNITPWRKAV